MVNLDVSKADFLRLATRWMQGVQKNSKIVPNFWIMFLGGMPQNLFRLALHLRCSSNKLHFLPKSNPPKFKIHTVDMKTVTHALSYFQFRYDSAGFSKQFVKLKCTSWV